eukprot:COSAG05_NODE_352_length_10911_cov_31.817139_6_plen_91_part_00
MSVDSRFEYISDIYHYKEYIQQHVHQVDMRPDNVRVRQNVKTMANDEVIVHSSIRYFDTVATDWFTKMKLREKASKVAPKVQLVLSVLHT